MILAVFNVLSLYRYIKYIDYICPHFPLSIHPSPFMSTLPLTGPTTHSCPSLFNCVYIIQRGFAMAFTCEYIVLYLSRPFNYSSLSLPLPHVVQQLLVLFYVPSSSPDVIYLFDWSQVLTIWN
jgi:hypothetical protein